MGTRRLPAKLAEEIGDGELPVEPIESSRTQYSRVRSARTSTRRSSRTAKRIELGMSGRRQRKWNW